MEYIICSYIFFRLLTVSTGLHAQDTLGDFSVLVHKTHAERTKLLTFYYEKFIYESDSLSIFSAIEKIEQLAVRENDRALLLEAALMRAHYFHYRIYFPKEFVLQKMMALDQIAKEEDVQWLQARIQSLLGNYYYYSHKEYALGFEHYERCAQILESLSAQEFPLKQACLYQIALVYYEFREYKEAIRHLRKAIHSTPEINHYYYEMQTYNTMGLTYRHLGQLDSSDYFFNQALNKAQQMNDTQWKGIAMGNLGINQHLMGNDDEAIPLMNIDLQIAKKYEDWGPAAEALTNLSYISFRSGNIAQSKQMAYEAMRYARKSGQQKRLLKIFPLLSKLEAYDMNPALAEIYMDSALMVKDSLDQIFNGQHLLRAKQRIQMEQQKFKAEKLEQEQQAGLKLRNAAITILILVLLILILIYYNHRLKTKNRIRLLASKAEMEKELNDIQLENVQLEKQHLLDQLEFKERELTSYALSLVRKNELLQRLEERIKFMDHGNSDIKSISNMIRTNTTQEGEWSEFNLRFNQVHKGFYETLREKFPDLSQNEERICALIRLNLNSREIANMLNINSRSVDQNKYRLKKKLKLNAEEGLHEYIAGL